MIQQVITDFESKELVHKDYRSSGAVTAQAVWTPASGKAAVITDIGGTLSAAGSVTIFYTSDATGHRIIDLDLVANTGPFGGVTMPFKCPVDAPVYVTTTGTGNLKIVMWGYEQ